MDTERLPIRGPEGIARVRRRARALGNQLGFTRDEVEAVTIAVSELATNLARYAKGGVIILTRVDGGRGAGIQVESRDGGPGIADVAKALEDGYSTGGGLGSGLPSVRRMMDEFAIESDPGGTVVVARKWPRSR